MGAYFYSFKIISQYGHVKVLMVGLLGNVIRFIYISFITWPWLVLPFEFLQGEFKVNSTIQNIKFRLCAGITHAAVWAACCSYISHNTDAELRPSMQSFLQVNTHYKHGRGESFKKKLIFRESIMVLADSAEPFLVGC